MTLSDEDLMRELLSTFHAEAEEYLQSLNKALLQLERHPEDSKRTELLQESFRVAHSLKGAARAVDFSQVEKLAHGMEDVLKQARDDALELTPARCDVLYNVLDAIQVLLSGHDRDIDDLITTLGTIGNGSKPSKNGEAPRRKSRNPRSKKEEPVDNIIEETELVEEAENPEQPSPESPVSDPMTGIGDADSSIRVAVNKLDSLMAQAGELTVARISSEQRSGEMQNIRRSVGQFPRFWREIQSALGRLDREDDKVLRLTSLLDRHYDYMQDLTREINLADAGVKRDSLQLAMVTDRIHDEMRRVRMIPFQSLEALLQRAVRDAARTEEKQVELIIEGNSVELDKKVLENIKDPLLHILRNAVSHGIEKPAVREKVNKPQEGVIRLEVTQRGSEAHISITDDGSGFDMDTLRLTAQRARGNDQIELSDDDIVSIAFMPGISTSKQITEISGRGVGLDVVRQRIETMQGRIQVDNRPGEGVTIRLIVPVSLAMTRVLLIKAGGERIGLPLQAVEKIISPDHVFSVEGQTMITVDDKPLPLLPLSTLLGLPDVENPDPLAIVMGVGDQRIAILVDDVLTEQEVAVKTFGRPVLRVRNLSGAALLGNGEPVIILNTADIARSARGIKVSNVATYRAKTVEEEHAQEHILVVDDSITTRTLEKNILEAAGYQVTTATDGIEALKQLKNNGVALVVADVEMPNMDGITLTRNLRDNKNYRELPVILVTSLESPEDRERGMMAGANAYIVKRGFNQAELLATIEQLI